MNTNTQIMRKPLVLVAADDVDQGTSMQGVLQQFGFRTLAADGGESAYALFVENQPDAVLLDVHAAEYDGFATCAKIRNHESGGETPIFMVIDRDDDDAIEHAYRIGATDIIFNPVALTVLPHRVRYAFKDGAFAKRLARFGSCDSRSHFCCQRTR